MSDSSLIGMYEYQRLREIRKKNDKKKRVNPSDISFMLDLMDKMQERASQDQQKVDAQELIE